MLKLLIPAGLVAFLVPVAFALLVNSGKADPQQKEIVVAQANVVTAAPSAGADKVVQPDAMPELGQTPSPTPTPDPVLPKLTPLPNPEPALATPVVTPPPVEALKATPKPAEPKATAAPAEEKSRKAISDDVIEETPTTKSSETKSKSSSEKPKSEPSKDGREPAGDQVAQEPNGSTVVVTGRIISVEPDEGNSLRAEVKLRSGELVIILFPPWGGMRVPSIGGMVTAEARKLNTSNGQATLRALSIRSTGAPEGQPPARMVPGIRRAVVPVPVPVVPVPPPPPPPVYF